MVFSELTEDFNQYIVGHNKGLINYVHVWIILPGNVPLQIDYHGISTINTSQERKHIAGNVQPCTVWRNPKVSLKAIVAYVQIIAHIYGILHCNQFIIPSKATACDTMHPPKHHSAGTLNHCSCFTIKDFPSCGQYPMDVLRLPFKQNVFF